jgi:hypothetical protein
MSAKLKPVERTDGARAESEEPTLAGSTESNGKGVPITDALWTVKEVADYLRRSPRWVQKALTYRPENPGSIPHFRLGAVNSKKRAPRFDPEDIRAWVKAGCPPAATFLSWKKK